MNKVVIYWSSTGNTLEIANKISSDLGCDLYSVSEISIADALKDDTL